MTSDPDNSAPEPTGPEARKSRLVFIGETAGLNTELAEAFAKLR